MDATRKTWLWCYQMHACMHKGTQTHTCNSIISKQRKPARHSRHVRAQDTHAHTQTHLQQQRVRWRSCAAPLASTRFLPFPEPPSIESPPCVCVHTNECGTHVCNKPMHQSTRSCTTKLAGHLFLRTQPCMQNACATSCLFGALPRVWGQRYWLRGYT